MATVVFDTHAYVKKLRSVGVPENQAKVQAEAIATLVNEQLVTKQSLDLRLAELKNGLITSVIGIAGAHGTPPEVFAGRHGSHVWIAGQGRVRKNTTT
jgi:hypothetical protein